jgi:hypothetical protein
MNYSLMRGAARSLGANQAIPEPAVPPLLEANARAEE